MTNQSDDPFDGPEWQRYADRARRELEPMVRDAAVAVSIVPDSGEVDPKLAIETGYMVLLDKPIIVAVTPGSKVPRKLAMVADEIVEVDTDDPRFPASIKAAIDRIMAKTGGI